ncbi:MAG: carcinine hydrolase/isopenicillin-N N-acyltransferase family protein [Eubacteriales bacterium]|nr:carcinine hydrolase/isopenicillin-N N-acyltransferase family protein [Eubacteriales bacterium]
MKRRNKIAALLAALMVMMQMTPAMAFGETAELMPAADPYSASIVMDAAIAEAAEEGSFDDVKETAVSEATLLSSGTNKATASDAVKIADHLYEVEYDHWNNKKAVMVSSLLAKYPFLYDREEIDDDYWDAEKQIQWLTGLPDDAQDLYKRLNEEGVWGDFLNSLQRPLCTSCRTGDLIGRNFDWAYDDVDEYIIRVPADKATGRHASLGVGSAFFPPFIQQIIGMEDILPVLTMDGINDAGVAINVNVVMSDTFGSGDTVGTRAQKPFGENMDNVCAGFVVRYILDRADSAEHAVELLKKANIYSVLGQEFHWMISDAKATYIVETVSNELLVLKSKGKEAAMSNFHVTHSEHCEEYEIVWPESEKISREKTYVIENELMTRFSSLYFRYAMGVERYAMAKRDLSNIKAPAQMLSHMRGIRYKQTYVAGNEKKFWSDHNMYPYTDEQGNENQFTYYDNTEYQEKERMKTFKNAQETRKLIEETEKETGIRLPGMVHTVHTSVYEISSKTLTVNVQERDTPFVFRFDDPVHTNITNLYINGDNVGPAVRCDEKGQEWTYNKANKIVTLTGDGEYVVEWEPWSSDITIVKAGSQKDDPSGGGSSSSSAAPKQTYSSRWIVDENGAWHITDKNGNPLTNCWVCDDAVPGNGNSVWYLIREDGTLETAGLVQDAAGRFYSPETAHNGYFGMIRYKNGYYNCGGQQIWLEFSSNHDGTFGMIINADGIEKLKAIFGVTPVKAGNGNVINTASLQ